jgi:hypothetical protein
MLAEKCCGGVEQTIEFSNVCTSAAGRDGDAHAMVGRAEERRGGKCVADVGQDSELEEAKLAITQVGVDGGSIGVELELEVELRQGLAHGLAKNGRNVWVQKVVGKFVDCGGHGGGKRLLDGAL